MERVNKILKHSKYIEYLNKIRKYEKDRELCKHDINHFLDVARTSYIVLLERNIRVEKEIVYATALLHDIGRWQQYKDKTPHDKASAELAEPILRDCDFNEDEINMIISTILKHRNKNNEEGTFEEIFASCDKISRNCFNCIAVDKCKWSEEKKNYLIII